MKTQWQKPVNTLKIEWNKLRMVYSSCRGNSGLITQI